MDEEKGFTILEAIVVVAIIAIIGTLAAVAVNTARSKQRDATRISEVRQIQSALENHFNETNSYPLDNSLPLGDALSSRCLGTGGFQGSCDGDEMVFLRVIPPIVDTGLKGSVRCGQPARNAICYSQLKEGAEYFIEFELENSISSVGLAKGVNCALLSGMRGGACSRF